MLGAGAVGVYIASPILRDDSVSLQDIKSTHYESMVGFMKNLSNVYGMQGYVYSKDPVRL